MTVAIYARVSTKDRGQDTENQLRELRAFAAKEEWIVVDEYVDTASGSGKVRRPQFERMMEDAVAGRFCMLLFWSLDRLSREGVGKTVGYLDRLTAAHVEWKSFTEQYLDSCGIFKDAVLAILAVIAKQERIRISERTIAGLATARLKGRVGGRRPIDKQEEQIRDMRANGSSYAKIAEATKLSIATISRVCAGQSLAEPKAGFVYVVSHAGHGGLQPLLRIGFSSQPEKRARQLTADYPLRDGLAPIDRDPADYVLLRAMPGTFDHERELHRELERFNIAGSWYSDSEEIRQILRDKGFNV